MNDRTLTALADCLAGFDTVVEVGVGHRTDLAAALADSGADVTATDVHGREVPDGVQFVRDDVTDPRMSVYEDTDAVYALNLPPELHRPTAAVAQRADADFLFTTLGGDQPAIPVSRETLPGETLYVWDSGTSGRGQKEYERGPHSSRQP